MSIHHDGLDEKPPDSSYYESLTIEQRQRYDRQQLFLKAYSRLGRIYKAAEASNVPVDTVESWQRRDTHGFNKRMQQAHQEYVENLEQLMDERLQNPTGNRGSDVLLMFKLKAKAPQKYREEVKVVGIEASKQMMDRLRELAAKDRERSALEAPAVEDVYQEVTQASPPTPAEAPPMKPVPIPSPPTTARPVGKKQLMAQRLRKKQGRVTRR